MQEKTKEELERDRQMEKVMREINLFASSRGIYPVKN